MTPHDLQFLYPELILFGGALILLMCGIFKMSRFFLGAAAYGTTAAALFFLGGSASNEASYFYGLLHCDGLSVFFRALILLSTALVVFLSFEHEGISDEDRGEYYFFILTLCLSMMIAVSSRHLMMLYIALEGVSIISYVLVGYGRSDARSAEAGLKYFIFGALSTGIMLYGISIFYGLFRSLDLMDISLAAHLGTGQLPLFMLAALLVMGGILFKCSLVPFHLSVPDAYQGAPTPVTVYLSIAVKAMGFGVLTRFLMTGPSFLIAHWHALGQVLAVLTMTIGNISALRQSNLKRMLAYSSIAHAGFMLIALVAAGTLGFKALLAYLFIYVFMNTAAFGAAMYLDCREMEDLSGAARQQPLIAAVMAVALLSLAGLPPLAGFMAKFLVLAAAVQAKLYVLAVIGVLNSVVALFYYLRPIKAMYYNEPAPLGKPRLMPLLWCVLVLTMVVNIMLGIWPDILLQRIPV